MQKLSSFEKKDFAALLASDKLDASNGALFNVQGLAPSTNRCSIFIGLGGQGVQTLDYIKGELIKRMDPSWENYVNFLGIDASWSEFDHARYLDKEETLMITDAGAAARMSKPATYPAATRRFMLEDAKLGAMASDGSGRTRLVGKVKIHDQAPGSLGFDEKVVQKLERICGDHSGYLTSSYDVYVLGSVCGGTCSGTFLELPSLIRKQLPDAKIHAMLFLPDTLAPLDPANSSALFANGYASLKELNYFMGMYMRPGYSETWTYGNASSRELTYSSSAATEGFIDVPYLIGAPNGGAGTHTIREAKATIAEFIISMLAPMQATNGNPFDATAFASNANAASKVGNKLTDPANSALEHAGEFHEFPKRFSAIGYAAAAVPHKTVRAYTVSKACHMAGFKPVPQAERNILAANGEGFLPFKAEDDFETATIGTGKAEKILAPLSNILGRINNGTFTFEADLMQQDVTWRKIKDGHYDHQSILQLRDRVIANRTSPDEMTKIENAIQEAFATYRKNVQEFVKVEGPFAFYNLFEGRFIPQGNNNGIGIRKMIQYLVDGKQMTNGQSVPFLTAQQAQQQLNAHRTVINGTGFFSLEHATQKAQWVSLYNAWGAAEINETRRKGALGTTGYLYKKFLVPAIALAEDVLAFGNVLNTMTDIYNFHGSKMKDFQEFAEATDRECEVNLASVNVHSYQWIKNMADNDTAVINARNLRDNIVDHFFARDNEGPNSRKWLDFEDNYVTQTPTGYQLTNAEAAVPARAMFDELISQNYEDNMEITIDTMFNQLAATGTNYSATANAIMDKLARKSVPMFNGKIHDQAFVRYIVYPDALNDGIQQAISTAADNRFPGINIISSKNATAIMLYQQAAPLEIYRLSGLANWEKEYEKGNFGIQNKNAYLHGKSPDITTIMVPGQATQYIEGMPWKDYPSIAPKDGDPRKKDPATGQISHEGKLRLALDDLIKEARELGVLYSQEVDGCWSVYRIHCDRSIDWNFELIQCTPDPLTMMLPLGLGLAQEVANQNHKHLEDLTAVVRMDLGGLLSNTHPTEALAWEFAARTLRAHVPMYIEVRETVKKFRVWAEEIKRYNSELQRGRLPAMMVNMLSAQILCKDANDVWHFVQADGKKKVIANLAPAFQAFLPPQDRAMIQNGLFGYFLFKKLDAALAGNVEAFSEANERAKSAVADWVAQEDLASLQVGLEYKTLIEQETSDLIAKGAQLDGTDRTSTGMFVRTMAQIPGANLNEKAVKEIEQFYYRTTLVHLV